MIDEDLRNESESPGFAYSQIQDRINAIMKHRLSLFCVLAFRTGVSSIVNILLLPSTTATFKQTF